MSNTNSTPNTKAALYALIERTVANLLANTVLSPFTPWVSDYVIKFIDPYVSAFADPATNFLDIDQLGAFAEEEVKAKIDAFKANYRRRDQ